MWYSGARLRAYSSEEICALIAAVLDGEGAADEDGAIRDISIRESGLCLRRQSAHTPEYYDEQPSAYGVYPHDLSWLYARGVDGLEVEGRLCLDAFMAEHISSEPTLINCRNTLLSIRNQQTV